MADQKISQLPSAITIEDADFLTSVQASNNVKFTGSVLYDQIGWKKAGTDVSTYSTSLNVNLGTAGLKDSNVTTPVPLGDTLNSSLTTTNQTLIGAINEINSASGIVPLDRGGTGINAAGVTDGQLFIGGSTSNDVQLATIQGTGNQINVTNGNNSINLSTPQNIDINANVQFNDVAIQNISPNADSAVRRDFVDNLIDGLLWKDPVDLATTGNVTLSGEQNIDGVLTNNSRVLVWKQNNQTENGFYDTNAGAWTRTSDASTGAELLKAATNVIAGASQEGVEFVNSNINAITIGVTNITFVTKSNSINHNNTSGLQGGITNEYFHLTQNQHVEATQFASATLNGLLSSVDWNTFNNKPTTFIGLTDTPSGYFNANAILTNNNTLSGVIETSTILTEPAPDQFNLQRGVADLTVSSNVTLDQDLSQTSNPTFNTITGTSITTGVVFSNNGLLSGGHLVDLQGEVQGILPISNGGTAGTSETEARSNLGLAIGIDVQAYNITLQELSLLPYAGGDLLVGSGQAGNLTNLPIGSNGQLLVSNGSAPVWQDQSTINPFNQSLNTFDFVAFESLNLGSSGSFVTSLTLNSVASGSNEIAFSYTGFNRAGVLEFQNNNNQFVIYVPNVTNIFSQPAFYYSTQNDPTLLSDGAEFKIRGSNNEFAKLSLESTNLTAWEVACKPGVIPEFWIKQNGAAAPEFRISNSQTTISGPTVIRQGATQNSSALTINGTDRGFLLPRVTTIQKNAITAPATGLQVFDTTSNVLEYYNGSVWKTPNGGIYTYGFNQTVSINNTTTETSITPAGQGSLLIPANTLEVGSTYRITFSGNAVLSNSTNINVRGTLNNNAFFFGLVDVDTATDVFNAELVVRFTNASAQSCSTFSSLMFQYFDSTTMKGDGNSGFNAGTLDASVDQTIDITLQFTNTSSSITVNQLLIEKVK